MAKKISAAEYARQKNVSRNAVKKAIQEGRITAEIDERGRCFIDPKKADKEWEKNTTPKKNTRIVESSGTGSKKKMSYADARALKENFSAQMAEQKFLEAQGKLVSVDKVRSDAAKIGATLKDQLMNLPERLAPMLAPINDVREISILIKQEINHTLEGIINELSRK